MSQYSNHFNEIEKLDKYALIIHIVYMPTILLLANMIKITINPNDKHRFPHVHVIHAEKSALISLEGFEVLENSGFSEKTLKKVIAVLKGEHELLMNAWSEYNG